MRNVTFTLALLAVVTSACASDPATDTHRDTTEQTVDAQPTALEVSAGYDFEQPDVSFALPEVLQEISGLTLLPDGNLGAIQDEVGTVFVVNPNSGAIESRHSFADAGDYEGIEQVGDVLYVLRSDGTLTELALGGAAQSDPKTIETALKRKNDTEGLAYDERSNRLLIACKEDPGDGHDEDHKVIYAYDLSSGELEPAFAIDTKQLEDEFDVLGKFKPAGLAVRPDGSVLVLSATAKAIAVVSADGSVQEYWDLPGNMFEQPEAIVLGGDGTLYVASEGGDGPGMLYAFSRRAAGS